MWQFDESAAQFPPPRSEEPAELRRAIVEELADHLSCALRREQLAGGQQEIHSARQRVLTRFGDPAAVARRLWFDALWEKIMLQRIVTTACVVLAAVSCLALLLAWQSLTRQQDLLASWQTNSETQAREQRELFEKLLAQSDKQAQANADSLRELQGLAAAGQAPVEWNPVEFRFVAGAEDGPPLAGINVTMTINNSQESGIPPMRGTSDERGMVQFKRAHFGTYNLELKCPSGESRTDELILLPGENTSIAIVCPDPPAKAVPLNIRAEWPDEFAGRGLCFYFSQDVVRRRVDGQLWYWLDGSMLQDNSARQVLVDEKGDAFGVQTRLTPESQLTAYTRTTNAEPTPILWPGMHFTLDELCVLLPAPLDLQSQNSQADSLEKWYCMQVLSADWGYRLEPGADGAPGTLWLTPTPEAIERIKQYLVTLDVIIARELKEESDAAVEAGAE